jgi:hypothetical protein
MLGKGTVNIFKKPYRVISGILVSEGKTSKEVNYNTPNKIFTENINK